MAPAAPASSARLPLLTVLFPYLLVLAVAVLTPTSSMFPDQGDVNLYLTKAHDFASGLVPYRDVAFEYPPAALIPMVVPYLLWPFSPIDLGLYKLLFAGWEAFLMLALAIVLGRIVRLGGVDVAPGTGKPFRDTGIRLGIVAVGAVLAITWRFDLYPALLVMVALWAALEGRAGAAGLAVGIGILAKLYPLAVVPALALPLLAPFDVGRLIRYGGALAATVIAGLLPFVAIAGPKTFEFLRYQSERGLQIESIGGGLAILNGMLAGSAPRLTFGFASVNVEGDFAAAWLSILPVLQVVGFGLIAFLGWRWISAARAAGTAEIPARIVVAFAFASVLMLLVTSKVYSIQYVVWIVPFAALLGWRMFALAALVAGLTMPIHPILYPDLVKQTPIAIEVLNLRNALVVLLLGWALRKLAQSPGAEELARPAGLGGTQPTVDRHRIRIEGRDDWLRASRSA
jgi:hypothetical protein